MHEARTVIKNFARISRFAGTLAPSSTTGTVARMIQAQLIAPHASRIAAMSFLSSAASMSGTHEVTRMTQSLRITPHVDSTVAMSFLSSASARAREVARISDVSFIARMDVSASVRDAMSLLSSSAHARLMRQHASAFGPTMLVPKFTKPRVHQSSPRLEAVPLRNPWGQGCPVCEHNAHVADEFDREPDGNIGYRLGRFGQRD